MWILPVIVIISILKKNMISSHAGPSSESYCSKLDQYYKELMDTKLPLKGQLRSVMVDGMMRQVEVYGGGGAARAAAALLFVIIRYGLRYNTLLISSDANLCELSTRAYYWTQAAVVAPTALMPITGCKTSEKGLDRISSLRGPAVSSDLHLFMYLAPEERYNCAATASVWTYYVNSTRNCSFVKPDDIGFKNHNCRDCAVILVRNGSKNDIDVAEKYRKQFLTKHLYLELVFYDNDLNLRHAMEKLRKKHISFLFIYEDIWSGVEGIYHIQPPPCDNSVEVCYNINSASSVRIGDGTFFNYYAPEISKAVNLFAPSTMTLRQILEHEETNFSIEEATCFWALNTSENEFKSYFYDKYIQAPYEIILYSCNNDDYDKYDTIITPIKDYIKTANISDLHFDILKPDLTLSGFDCNSTSTLVKNLKRVSQRRQTIGVVLGGWTDKIISVVETAKKVEIFLTFAGPVTTEMQLESTTCRSASGNLQDLAFAYHYFFQSSNWNRIAIISEESDYAKSFTEALIITNNFTYDEKVITYQNIDSTLKEYQKLDARIFVVNTKWNLARQILCKALQLGMTSIKHVWITREGHVLRCCKNNTVKDFRHFSIGLEWRGGVLPNDSSIFTREKWIQMYDKDKYISKASPSNEWDDFVLPPGAFFLTDAIVLLVRAFTNFRSNYPSRLYDLHGKGSAALMSTSFNKATSVKGSMVFVDEWHNDKLRSLAVWEVKNKMVIDKWLSNINIFVNNRKISDRTYCNFSSGNLFAPRCHDLTVLLSTVALLLLAVTFIVARRMRLAQLARRDLFMIGSLLEHRKQVASTLDTYLVDRHLVKLSHEIGSGCFGRVHFAELKLPGCDAVVVAAKEPHEGIAPEEEREFLHEACILAPLSHDHVIRLIGICLKDGPPMVLMEHALHLDLQRYLIERRHLALKARASSTEKTLDDVSDESLTRLVRQAAAALDYLAKRRLVHRDVRAANCLIDKERSLKLADFGMARQLSRSEPEYATRRRALFPVLWMAPESLEQGVFSPASDVWALGVLILEVVTLGARPFGNWPPARVLRYVASGGHAPLPPDTSIHTRNLVTTCWRREPETRPSAAEVQHYLKLNPEALSAALLPANPSTSNEQLYNKEQ